MNESEKEFYLDQIENKYLDRQELSDEELSQAPLMLGSANLRDSVTVCAAILCAKRASEEVRRAARSRFEQICADLCQRDDGYKVDVLFALFQIPVQELASSEVMKALAYNSIHAERTSLRCNAVAALERLHKLGDLTASSLLREALQDPDQKVRKSASIALGRSENETQ